MRRVSITRRILAMAMLASLALASAPGLAVERDALETAIVYNLLLFVEWPGEAAWEPRTLTLCFDPASPLMAPARALDGRPVRGLRLAVQPLDAEPRRCQAIVVDTAAGAKAAATVRNNAGKDAVLLVEASGYDRCESTTIQLVEADGRIGFDISLKRAKEVGLSVSSRLLRLARKVSE
jgi:hypothetical protein